MADEYKIVHGQWEDFEKEASALIRQGYEPVGPLTEETPNSWGPWFTQGFIRRPSTDDIATFRSMRKREQLAMNVDTRDPDNPCSHWSKWSPGDRRGDCSGDGHYRCPECREWGAAKSCSKHEEKEPVETKLLMEEFFERTAMCDGIHCNGCNMAMLPPKGHDFRRLLAGACPNCGREGKLHAMGVYDIVTANGIPLAFDDPHFAVIFEEMPRKSDAMDIRYMIEAGRKYVEEEQGV